MYKIKRNESVPEELIQKAIELDHGAFPVPDWITAEDADMIYHNKKDCLILLLDDDKPVGLATIFALNKAIPQESMQKSKPIYKLLSDDNMADPDTGILYCHCFLLLPEWRGKGLIYKLYDGLREWLEIKGEGYSEMYADAVSEEGSRSLERLGFQPVFSFGEEGMLYKGERKSVIDTIKKMKIPYQE